MLFHLVVQLLSQGAFGYLLPIISFVLAWIETWLLDFKVLPQEAEDENSESQSHEFVRRSLAVTPTPPSRSVLSVFQDICPSWTPQSERLSCIRVQFLTDSSTLHRSLWQVCGLSLTLTPKKQPHTSASGVNQCIFSNCSLIFLFCIFVSLSRSDSDEELDDKHDPEKGLIQQLT